MSRIFTPFDPDAIGGAVVVKHAPATGETMLSEVIEQQDWHAPEAEDVETTGPGDLEKGSGPGTSKPLDNHAKWRLSELAERAYTLLKQRGLLAGETLEGYRRRISIKACGKRISQASLGDRMTIQSAFLKEMERAEEAAKAAMKAQGTARDIALFKLRELCEKRGYPANYGEVIAWRFYKTRLQDLAAKAVWRVFFTVQNNANERDGKGNTNNRWKKLKAKRAARSETQQR